VRGVTRSGGARRRLFENYGLPALTLLAMFVLWQGATKLFRIPVWLVPAPSDIVLAILERGHGLWIHIWITFYETLLGFGLAIVLGVPLAVAVVHSRVIGNAIYPLILITQSIPKVAFAPILLIWLGYGDFPKILVAFLVAFFPVVVDTATGLRSPAPQLLDLARQLNASQLQIYTKIRFPSALPHFFSGLKVAITLAVIGAVIGEFVGSERGLGFLVVQSTSHFKTPLAFAAMSLLALMAMVLFFAVVAVERVMCPWFGRGSE
jgi:NitT/TauT family transport system permease protein